MKAALVFFAGVVVLLLGIAFLSHRGSPQPGFAFTKGINFKYLGTTSGPGMTSRENWRASLKADRQALIKAAEAEFPRALRYLPRPGTHSALIIDGLEIWFIEGRFQEGTDTIDGNQRDWVTVTIGKPRKPSILDRVGDFLRHLLP